MKYIQQQRIRRIPPLIIASLLAIFTLCFAVGAMDTKYESSLAEASETSRVTYNSYPEIQSETLHTSAQTEEPSVSTEEPKPEPETGHSLIGSRDWEADESELLCRIAMAEAESEGVQGKALVMLVVLNRVWSDGFPGTIKEVVFQKNQFTPTAEGGRYWTTEPDAECYEALDMVMQGWDESQGALYFESCKGESWHSRNLEFLFQYRNHKFYK